MKHHFSRAKLSMITFTLVLGSVIVNSAVNMNTPVLPDISDYFGISDNLTQWTIISFFLGTAIAALFYGPLADYYGRRIMLLIGMGLFCASSVACMAATGIYGLITARFIQGLGGVASSVIWLTIIKDIYKGNDSVRILNVFNITISISLSIAPIIGSFSASLWGWRGSFAILSILSFLHLILVFFVIPETLYLASRPFISAKKAFQGFRVVFFNRDFVTLSIINGIIHGVHAAQMPLFSLYFQDGLGISRDSFALYQFIPILFYSLSAVFVRNTVNQQGISKTFILGMYWLALYSLSVVVTMLWFPSSAIIIGGTYCIFSICCPFIATVVTTLAMESVPEMGGVSSSAMTSTRQLMASIIAFSGAQFYTLSFESIAIVMLFYVAVLGFITIWGKTISLLNRHT
jgi:MFS transporter, DHA1 family, multidrug resistance protein